MTAWTVVLLGLIAAAPGDPPRWAVGSTHRVTWDAGRFPGAATVRVEFSSDGGKTWRPAATAPNTGEVLWTVPDAVSDAGRVRVHAGDPNTAWSGGLFAVVPSQAVPDYESTITARLADAGLVLVGKLNLLEFAMGSGVVSGFGPARNPWDLAYSPAGSSSGSGAALAAHLVPLSIGTDTGGSIRIPAS